MSDQMNELVDGVARAILKVRFYDPEPDMYDSLDSFWLELDEDHWLDARQEAEAAIAAVQANAAIVPKGATREMLVEAAGLENATAIHNYGGTPSADDYWSAMVAASPYNPK